MSGDHGIEAIVESAEALANAWFDAITAGKETALTQAAIGYADASWGNPEALAAGLLACGNIVYSINTHLAEARPQAEDIMLSRILMCAGTLLSMYSIALRHVDLGLSNACARTIATVLGEGGGPVYPLLINQSEVPNT